MKSKGEHCHTAAWWPKALVNDSARFDFGPTLRHWHHHKQASAQRPKCYVNVGLASSPSSSSAAAAVAAAAAAAATSWSVGPHASIQCMLHSACSALPGCTSVAHGYRSRSTLVFGRLSGGP